jgi:hypothetical protein
MFLGLCGHQEDLPAIRAAGLGAGGKPLTSTIRVLGSNGAENRFKKISSNLFLDFLRVS